MKHVIRLFAAMVFLVSCTASYAAPIGDIGLPAKLKSVFGKDTKSKFGVAATGEVDVIGNRRMKDQASDTEIKFYGAKAGIILADKAFLYGIGGVAEADQKFKVSGSDVEWNTDSDPAWGAGATVICFERETRIRSGKVLVRGGVDARYRHLDLGVDKVVLNGASFDVNSSGATNTKFELDEWQIAFALSAQIDRISPYIGIKYSDIDGDLDARISGTDYKVEPGADSNVGMFAGFDAAITDSISINGEMRFSDEEAFSLGGSFRF